MRVLVDATAVPDDRGGVGRYLDELLHALAKQDVDLVVVCQQRDMGRMRELLTGAELVAAPAAVAGRAGRFVWEQIGLPLLARRVRADVLHSPHYTSPLVCRAARVVTLHDATFFSDPEVHSTVKKWFFRIATWVAVRRADALVVPSQATRDEVLHHVGGRPEKFHVAHHGVDTAVFRPVGQDEVARVAATLGLVGQAYVAFLGTLEPRKNVPALIRGWVAAVQGVPDPPALVLAGGKGWDTEVEPTVEAVPPELKVVMPGYVPFDDLAGLLSGAQIVAYPSLAEGFGLPILEAMACGAPVLTTRRTSLPEVGGDAVEYTDTDAASIAGVMRRLLDDPARRAELSDAAVHRAAKFTWDAAAAAHVGAYQAAATRDRGARRG